MNRRRYLAALSASTLGVGCLGQDSPAQSGRGRTSTTAPDESTEEETPTTMTDPLTGEAETETETEQSRTLRKVSFEGVVEAPDSLEIAVDTMRRGGVVWDIGTAKLGIAWRNTGEEPITVGNKLRVATLQSRNDEYEAEPGLTLFPLIGVAERESKRCPDYEPGSTYATRAIVDETEAKPGETVIQSYEVWGDPDAEGCMAPGVYQFGYDETPWMIALRVTDLTEKDD